MQIQLNLRECTVLYVVGYLRARTGMPGSFSEGSATADSHTRQIIGLTQEQPNNLTLYV